MASPTNFKVIAILVGIIVVLITIGVIVFFAVRSSNQAEGSQCSKNSDCALKACGRESADEGAPTVCCKSGKVVTYAFNDYCADMPDGTVCWSDSMCAGECKGNLGGLQKGVCEGDPKVKEILDKTFETTQAIQKQAQLEKEAEVQRILDDNFESTRDAAKTQAQLDNEAAAQRIVDETFAKTQPTAAKNQTQQTEVQRILDETFAKTQAVQKQAQLNKEAEVQRILDETFAKTRAMQ